jgi:dCTP deaminase
MILPAQTIRKLKPIMPFHERTIQYGMSFGLSHAGYDVRIAETIVLWPGEFVLGSTLEHFDMPNDLIAFVHDKSTWARHGLSLFNTVIEPGWKGYLTLELVNNSSKHMEISAGCPIAQIVFMRLEAETESPYTGKYQNQRAGAVPAILEGSDG